MGDNDAASTREGQRDRSQRAADAPSAPGGRRLADLIASYPRVALVGLAKNTGKTETLSAILAAHAHSGLTVGVTSIGRDGEERDVIDARIAKPRVRVQAGSVVATSAPLLRASEAAVEHLERTGIRTPLGDVVVARVAQAATLEIAGPSAAADVRAVSEAMARLGARQVLIDGAIDRRAASSPAVSDALVMATGAVLSEELERVVEQTTAAVELVRLPRARGGDEEPVRVRRELVLRADREEIARLVASLPPQRVLEVEGALSEAFLEGLVSARPRRGAPELRVLAHDPTHVFLSRHAPSWFARQGISIEVREPIELAAITVNPVAPQSHSFPSARLREALCAAIPDVSVLDVREP